MPTPAELRAQSRAYLEAAEKESAIDARRRLADHALSLAQLAEQIERAFVSGENIKRYRRMLAADDLDESLRRTIETLLAEELAGGGQPEKP